MAYQRPTINEIADRIESDLESRLTGDSPLLRWGILRVLARVFAGAVHLVYGYLEYLSLQLFATTAELTYLNRIGLMFGVTRKAASFATGKLTFAGADTTLVPEGTRVATEDGVEYETTADGTVSGGSVEIDATAVEPGTEGNMDSALPVELIEPLAGITGVTVTDLFAGGEDEETDDAYRARILERIQSPPAGGTAEDYVRWAKEVTGVDNAWCYPATPAPGQVTVVFRGSASIAQVEAYISTLMPVTADLTVLETNDLPVDFIIKLSPNTADAQAAVTANLEQLFEEQAEPGQDILISQVRNAISATGVTDYLITWITVDGVSKDPNLDIPFSGYDYGELDDITYQDL
jgi:uncharacterized phage protein gp47/JayE